MTAQGSVNGLATVKCDTLCVKNNTNRRRELGKHKTGRSVWTGGMPASQRTSKEDSKLGAPGSF